MIMYLGLFGHSAVRVTPYDTDTTYEMPFSEAYATIRGPRHFLGSGPLPSDLK